MFSLSSSRIGFVCLILLTSVAAWSPNARAKARLITMQDGVVAYSGPGEFYRPLAIFPARTELTAGSQVVRTKDGAFYKVIVKLSEKKSVIGYVSLQAMANYMNDKLEDEDLSKYGDVALVDKAMQISFSLLRDQGAIWTLGYMKYVKPGFYVKGFAGQFSNPLAKATVAGGEVGNDSLLLGNISGLVSYDLGVFMPSQAGTVFDASSKLDAMMQAGFGLRYNFGGIASISAAVTQAVFFNGNNSLVTSGGTFTLEVGL
jgi:hypothetical protein